MNEQIFLLLLPLCMTLTIVITLSFRHLNEYPNAASNGIGSLIASVADVTDSSTCFCNRDNKTNGYCYDNATPVLGGVDMVQFFTTFKISDGVYNESEVGQHGSSDYSSVYGNYTYYFVSKQNLRLFEANKSFYVPQWGGFCAWGVATEGCPKYGWSPSCMGPHGSWNYWTIQNEKIYFFWFATARSLFLENVDENVILGDDRWEGWYPNIKPNSSDAIISTNCVETTLLTKKVE